MKKGKATPNAKSDEPAVPGDRDMGPDEANLRSLQLLGSGVPAEEPPAPAPGPASGEGDEQHQTKQKLNQIVCSAEKQKSKFN